VRWARELVEIDHGDWSGLTREQVAEQWPELAEQWRTAPGGVTMPGGESLADVRRRALGFLAAVRQQHAEGDILVVTHGTVLRLLLAHFLDMRPDQIWSIEAENGGLSIVDDYEVPLIMAINDTCHLEGVRSSVSAQVR
jgi:phosphoserine phosphatase